MSFVVPWDKLYTSLTVSCFDYWFLLSPIYCIQKSLESMESHEIVTIRTIPWLSMDSKNVWIQYVLHIWRTSVTDSWVVNYVLSYESCPVSVIQCARFSYTIVTWELTCVRGSFSNEVGLGWVKHGGPQWMKIREKILNTILSFFAWYRYQRFHWDCFPILSLDMNTVLSA